MSNVDKVIYDTCSYIKFDPIPSIHWDELSRRMFWPLQGSLSQEFIIINGDMPEVLALFQISENKEMPIGQKGCDEYKITITGKDRSSQLSDVGSLVRGIRLTGSGNALICGGNSFPDAALIHLKRVVEPALWSAVDHEIEEDVEIAWSSIP